MFLVLVPVSFEAIFESSCGDEEWVTTPWGKCSPPKYRPEWEFHLDDLSSRNVDLQEEMHSQCIFQANQIDMREFGE